MGAYIVISLVLFAVSCLFLFFAWSDGEISFDSDNMWEDWLKTALFVSMPLLAWLWPIVLALALAAAAVALAASPFIVAYILWKAWQSWTMERKERNAGR